MESISAPLTTGSWRRSATVSDDISIGGEFTGENGLGVEKELGGGEKWERESGRRNQTANIVDLNLQVRRAAAGT
jgi:hypothetical protein